MTMKKNFLWMFAAILTCGFAMMLTSCSKSDDNSSSGGGGDNGGTNTGEIVFMYYGIGGSDLDVGTEAALANAAYEQSKSSNVRKFLQFKYSAKRNSDWNSNYEPSGDYGGVYRFEMNSTTLNPGYTLNGIYEAKAFTNISNKKIGSSDYKMYDPNNLAEFINWCVKEAPNAKAYVLAFGDHGGSYDVSRDYDKSQAAASRTMRGVMYDDNITGRPCMSPGEIATALSKVSTKINLIFFDCCIMSNLEVLGELQSVTDFVFASGHSVTQSPLSALCQALSKVPTASDINTGIKQYVGGYVTTILEEMRADVLKSATITERIKRSMDYTLTDMSKIPALYTSIKNVVDHLTSLTDVNTKIGDYNDAASACYHYVDNGPYYDIVGYLTALKDGVLKSDTQFATLVSQVSAAVKDCHVAHGEYSYDKNKTDKKYGLTYSVTLGFSSSRLNFDRIDFTAIGKTKPEAQGVIMSVVKAGKGTSASPYYNDYLLENGDNYLSDWKEGQEWNFLEITRYWKDGSHDYQSWANTYNTTKFDKATGWSKWMRMNPGIPDDNPPSDDQFTYVFNPSLDEFMGLE